MLLIDKLTEERLSIRITFITRASKLVVQHSPFNLAVHRFLCMTWIDFENCDVDGLKSSEVEELMVTASRLLDHATSAPAQWFDLIMRPPLDCIQYSRRHVMHLTIVEKINRNLVLKLIDVMNQHSLSTLHRHVAMLAMYFLARIVARTEAYLGGRFASSIVRHSITHRVMSFVKKFLLYNDAVLNAAAVSFLAVMRDDKQNKDPTLYLHEMNMSHSFLNPVLDFVSGYRVDVVYPCLIILYRLLDSSQSSSHDRSKLNFH